MQDSELTQERLIRDDLLHQVNSMDNFDELDSKLSCNIHYNKNVMTHCQYCSGELYDICLINKYFVILYCLYFDRIDMLILITK